MRAHGMTGYLSNLFIGVVDVVPTVACRHRVGYVLPHEPGHIQGYIKGHLGRLFYVYLGVQYRVTLNPFLSQYYYLSRDRAYVYTCGVHNFLRLISPSLEGRG